MAFSVVQAPALLRRYKNYEKFVSSASSLADATKSGKFTIQTKWSDWIPTFFNYLCAMPGRNEVPLKCIFRENDTPNPEPNADFLDDYINVAPLNFEAYVIDSAQGHTFIVKFVSGNETAEAKI